MKTTYQLIIEAIRNLNAGSEGKAIRKTRAICQRITNGAVLTAQEDEVFGLLLSEMQDKGILSRINERAAK